MSRVESWLPPGAGSQPMALLLIELDSQAITTELNYTAALRANCSAPFQASGTQYFETKTNFNVQTCKRRSDNKFILKVGLLNS